VPAPLRPDLAAAYDGVTATYTEQGVAAALAAMQTRGFPVTMGALERQMRRRHAKVAIPMVCTICGKKFLAKHPQRRYCSAECKRDGLNQIRRTGDTPKDEKEEEHDPVERLEVRTTQRRAKAEEKIDATRLMREEAFLKVVEGWKPRTYKPPPGLKSAPKDRGHIFHASDWHLGQDTGMESTGHLYQHNSEVAQAQLEKALVITRDILRDSGRQTTKMLLILNGDIHEGDDMRNSQHRQIDMLAAEQHMLAVDLTLWFINELLAFIPELVVSNIPGNHDRIGRNAGNAGLAELGYQDSFAWMLGEHIRRAMKYHGEKRVTVLNPKTFYSRLTFMGQRIVHAHGSDIKWSTGSYGGVPWYGIMNAARQYRGMLGAYDLIFFGHGHIPGRLFLEPKSWILMNGSLPGTSQYIQSRFKSVRMPVQQLVEVNEHGLVAEHPLYLDVGQMVDPEEAWDTGA
jgi:hypothetical protein